MKFFTLLGNLFAYFLISVSKTTYKGIFQTLGSWFNLFGLVGKMATLSLLILLSSFIPKEVAIGTTAAPIFEAYPAPTPMPNNLPANGSGSGTLLDPYVVNSFPYTFTGLNSAGGETASGMQGSCSALACCSVRVFKVTLPSAGVLRTEMLNFTPLAGSMIAYYALVPNPTNWSDIVYVTHAGNFCGYRDSLQLGRYWLGWRNTPYGAQPVAGTNSNQNVYDINSPNAITGFVPAGDYYILVFNENQQANLGTSLSTDITFEFAEACAPLTAPAELAYDTLEPNGVNSDTASFYVKNDRVLTVNLDSAYIAGDDSSQFSILTTLPDSIVVNDSILVEVAFTPTSGGLKQSTFTIEFSDTSCSTSNSISLSGMGAFSEITILGNGNEISNGDNSPSATDNTFIGAGIPLLSTLSKTYQIINAGFDTLEFTGSPIVQVSNSTAFSVSQQPPSTVLPGDTATFEISFSPTAETAFTSTVSITSNDPNSPFTFDVAGEGIPQNALNFDGTNDWVEINANAMAFVGATQITVEAWIKADPSGTNTDRVFAINTSGSGNVMLFGLNNGSLNFFDGTDSYEYSGGSDLRDDQWHHVGFSYDDGFLKVYLDGKIVKIDRVNTRTFSSSDRWSIGQEFDGSTRSDYFNGSIDEVRIWSDIRTDAEIADAYLCELSGGEDNLVSYYTFNQGVADGANSGETTLKDRGPNGYDGTLSNFGLTAAGSNWEAASGVAAGCSSSFQLVTNASSFTLNGGSSVSTSGIYTDSVGTNFYRYDVQIAYKEYTDNQNITGQSACQGDAISRTVKNIAVSALEFNSAHQDFVVLDNLTSTLAGSNRSVFMWVQVPAGTLAEAQYLFAVNRGSTDIESGMQIATNGEYRFWHGSALIDPNVAINDGLWHHIGYTYDDGSNNTIMYVDGAEVGNFSVDHSIASGDYISLGQEYDATTSSNHFDGFMSHVGIWNDVLTAAEVSSLFINSVNLQDSALVSFYPGYRNIADVNTSITDIKSGFHGQLSNINVTPIDSAFFITNSNFLSTLDTFSLTRNGVAFNQTNLNVSEAGIYNYTAAFSSVGYRLTQNWSDSIIEVITQQPENSFENIGQDAVFTVMAVGGATYQWYELDDTASVAVFSNGIDQAAVTGRNIFVGVREREFHVSHDHGITYEPLVLDSLIFDYANLDSIIQNLSSPPPFYTQAEWENQAAKDLLETYGFTFLSFVGGLPDPDPVPYQAVANGSEVYLLYEDRGGFIRLYSSDSGQTFIPQLASTAIDFDKFQYAAFAGKIYAYNSSGEYAVSNDQGATWATQTFADNLVDVYVAGGNVFLVGEDNLYTSADGTNFTTFSFPFSTGELRAMNGFASNLFIVSDQDILRSTDLGQNWTKLTNKVFGTTQKLFSQGNVLIAKATGFLLQSKDLGRSWEVIATVDENDQVAVDNLNTLVGDRRNGSVANVYYQLIPLSGETNNTLTIASTTQADEGRLFLVQVSSPSACEASSLPIEILIDPCTGTPTFNTVTTNSCGGYTGPSGFIYTVSGTYVDTLFNGNAAGCDSISTLNLTIFPAIVSGTTIIDSCGQATINGQVFINSQTLVDTFYNVTAGGCDSLHFTQYNIYRFPKPERLVADFGAATVEAITDSFVLFRSNHDAAVGDDVYYYNGDTLYALDINPGAGDYRFLTPLLEENGELYYTGNTSITSIGNLHKMDVNGNITDLTSFTTGGVIQTLTRVQGKLIFTRGVQINSQTVQELWVLENNGTITQVNTTTQNLRKLINPIVFNNKIYFEGEDGLDGNRTTGDEFIIFNPSDNSLTILELHPGIDPVNSDVLDADIKDPIVYSNRLLFQGSRSGAVGTNEDGDPEYFYTTEFLTLDTANNVSSFGELQFEDPYLFQGILYFITDNDSGKSAWHKYDGTSFEILRGDSLATNSNILEHNGYLHVGSKRISGNTIEETGFSHGVGAVSYAGEIWSTTSNGIFRTNDSRQEQFVYDVPTNINATSGGEITNYRMFMFKDSLYFMEFTSNDNNLYVIGSSGFNFNPDRNIITSCGEPVVFQGVTYFGDTVLYDTTTSIASHACDSIYVTQIIFDSISVELVSSQNAACEACPTGRITVAVSSAKSTIYDYIFSTGDSVLQSTSVARQITGLFSDTYSVTVTSEYGCSAADSAFVPYNGNPNQAPIAQDDIFSVFKGDTLIAFPLNNDTEPDNNGLTVTLLSLPDSGTAYISPVSNSILRRDTLYYIGTPTFFGFEQIQYAACDPINFCDTATITIEVKNNVGTALSFDGTNDFVNINSVAAAFGVVDSFTIEAWIKADSNQVGDDIIVGVNAPGTSTRTQINTLLDDGTLEVFADGVNLSFPSGDLRDEQWHHIAISYDGTRFSGYVDGELIGQIIESIDPFSTTDRWSIGQEYDGSSPGDYWMGDINEVRIWNVLRTPAQIQNQMHCALKGDETGLVAYYQFDQGLLESDNSSVTTLTDLTVNAANGTLTNFALAGVESNWVEGNVIYENCEILRTCENVDFSTPSGGTYSATGEYFEILSDVQNRDSVVYVAFEKNYSEIDLDRLTDDTLCLGESAAYNLPTNNHIQYLSFTKANQGYVNLNVLVDSLINTDRSIFLWIKQENQVSGDDQMIVAINESGTATVTNLITRTDEIIDLYDGANYRTSGVAVTDGNWHHIGYTYNEATNETKLYVDGVVEATYTNGQSIAAGARISLGQEFDGIVASDFYEGEMSQIAFYNKVITDAEVVSLFNAAPDSTEISEMLAFYPGRQICGGVGEFLEDVGPNGFHGIMTRTDIIQVDTVDTILNYNAANLYQSQWEVNGVVASSGSSVSINPTSVGINTIDLSMSGSGVAFTDGLEAFVSGLPTVDIINSQGSSSDEDVVCVGEPITLSANTDSVNTVAWFGFGDTFGSDSIGIVGVNPGDISMPKMAVSGTNIAAAYLQEDIGQIQVNVSTIGGTWTSLPANAPTAINNRYDLELINNNVHLLYQDASTGQLLLKEYTGVWNTVGGPIGTNGTLNKPAVLEFNNEIHVAYNTTSTLMVLKIAAGSWQNVGAAGFASGSVAELFEFNGLLHCLIVESSVGPFPTFTTTYFPSIYTYNGNSWDSLGSTRFSGTPIANRLDITQAVYNNTLYVAYTDDNNGDRAAVKMYDGNTWVNLGQNPITTNKAREPQLIVVGNSLYLLYIDDVADNIQAKKWNGNTWEDALPINNNQTTRFSATSLGSSLQVLAEEQAGTNAQGGSLNSPLLYNYGIVYGQIGTGPTVNINNSGDFTVQVTNPFGCVSAIDTVNVRDTFKLEMQIADISCFGANDGIVTAADCGLENPIYIWNTGDSLRTISNLSAGTYSVTVASDNQDTLFGSATITEPAPLVADIIQGDTAFFLAGDSVQLSVNPVAGVTYEWYNSDGWNTLGLDTFLTGYNFNQVELGTNASGNLMFSAIQLSNNSIEIQEFASGSWQQLANTLPYTSGASYVSQSFDSNGDLYIAYRLNRGAYIKKFDGSSWVDVGAQPIHTNIERLDFEIVNDTIYLAVLEENSNNQTVVVKRFTNNQWVTIVDNGFTASIIDPLTYIDLGVYNGLPLIGYLSNSLGNGQKYYDGNSWINVNMQLLTGFAPVLMSSNSGNLYSPVQDANDNRMSVFQFNGTSWDPVGNRSFSDNPIGFTYLTESADGTLYSAFRENSTDSLNKTWSIMAYLNSNWSYVGDRGTGFNATGITVELFNNKPVTAFTGNSITGISVQTYGRDVLQVGPSYYASELGNVFLAATNANGCAAYDTVYVDTLPPCVPSFDALALDLVNHTSCDTCADGSLAVNFTNPTSTYTYLWGNGETTATAVALPLGIHTVTITDSSGCVYTETGEIFDQSSFFITKWNTRNPAKTDSLTVEIPALNGTAYLFDIDWDGDGVFDEFQVKGTQTHVYPSAGIYTINIKGNFAGWIFRPFTNPSDDANKLVEVVQWGAPQWSTMRRAFMNCKNLAITASDAPDLSQATSLEEVFKLATNFNSDLSDWDVSTIQNFSRAFDACEFFNQDLSSWDVSSGTNFSNMFSNAKSFNSDISGWNMSNAVSMERMFNNATVFNQDISSWDVQNVSDFSYTFSNAKAFNQNIGTWNTSSAIEMLAMFNGAEEFNQDIGAWDVDSVEHMGAMFQNARKFNQNLNTWDVSSVTNMRSMFSGASVFNGDISSWDVSSVQGMKQMFNNATSFNQDISSWNVSSVLDMDFMFSSASAFNQDIGNWDVSSVTNMRWMFQRASDFNQDLRNWDVSSVTDMNAMFSRSGFDQNIGMWDMDSVSDVSGMFSTVTLSISNYDSILIGWAAQNLLDSLNFNGGFSNFCLGDSARQYMINTLGWTIADNGKFCGPPTVSIVLDANETCFGSADGSATATVSGGTEPYSFTWSNGVTTATLTAGAATYYLTVTDAQAQQVFDTVTITSPTEIVLSNTQVQPDCGANNGSVDITPSGGAGGYSFAWSNSATTEDLTSVAAGTYTVTITDGNGCTSSPSVNVSNANGIIVSSSATDETCRNDATGSITLSVSGGTPTYNFAWSSGETTQNISGKTSGIYTVSVTDQGGCLTVVSDTISQPDELNLSFTVNPPTCAEDSDAVVRVTILNPSSTYSYSWSNGSTADSALGLPYGIFAVVTITDLNSCETVDSISIFTFPSLIISAQVDSNISCNGLSNGQASVLVSGGRGGNTYAWSNGSIVQSIDSLAVGKYYISVTDQGGCQRVDSVEIQEPTSLSLTAALIQNVSCQGGSDGSAEVTVSGGTLPYNFMWSDSVNTQNDTLANAQAGLYTVVVADGNGCSDSASVNINQPSLIFSASTIQACFGDTVDQFGFDIISDTTFTDTLMSSNGCDSIAQITVNFTPQLNRQFVKTNISCFGETDGSVNVMASGGTSPYSYAWESGSTFNSADSLTAGFETVTITDANSCILIDSVEITAPAQLAVSVNETLPIACFGGTNGFVESNVTGGTAPYLYSWSNGSTNSFANNLGAGEITVTVTDSRGCTAIGLDTLENPVRLVISIDSISNVSCFGFSDGFVRAELSGVQGVAGIYWSTGLVGASITTSAANGIVTARDSVAIEFPANSGSFINFVCEDTASYMIMEPDSFTVDYITQKNASCNGETDAEVLFDFEGGTAPYTALFDASFIAGNDTVIIGGATQFVLGFEDANGCLAVDTIRVTEPTALALSFNAEAVSCFGFTDGSSTVNVTGGTMPYSYAWESGSADTVQTGLAAGYETVTITDANNCELIDSVLINEPTFLQASITISHEPSCFGGDNGFATAVGTGGSVPYIYSWSQGSSTQQVNTLSAGPVSVTITDVNGCTATSTTTLNEPTELIATAVQDSTVSCFGFADGVASVSATGSTGNYQYAWSTGTFGATANGLAAGTYTVTVSDFIQPPVGTAGAPIIIVPSCSTTTSVTITQPDSFEVNLSTLNNVSCNGGFDGSISLDFEGGTAPFTSYLSNGIIIPVANRFTLLGDTSFMNVTPALSQESGFIDANGCVAIDSMTVTQPTSLALSFNNSNASCFGFTDGSSTVNVTGGTMPYSYAWESGSADTVQTGLAAGYETVTITDANNCELIDSVLINEPTFLQASITVTQEPSCFGGDNGYATAVGTGGSVPYVYAWSQGSSTQQVNNLSAGPVSVTITDVNGCVATSTTTLNEPTELIATAVQDSAVSCFGLADGVASVSATGSTGNYQYAWSTGTFGTTASGLAAGTYTVTVSDFLQPVAGTTGAPIISVSRCSATTTVTITEPDSLQISLTETGSILCAGNQTGEISATAQGGTMPYVFSHTQGSNTTGVFSNLGAGTYNLTVTDGNGCFTSASITLNEPSALQTSTAITQAISCFAAADGAVATSPQGGTAPYSYAWSTGDTISSVSGLDTGLVSVTITDANGCSITDSQPIAQPALIIGFDSRAVCDSSSTVLPSGKTVLWNAGTVQDTIAAANGCDSVITFTINVLPLSFTTGSMTICDGDSAMIHGVMQFTQGSYTQVYTAANGCDSASTISLFLNPVFNPSQHITICEGDSALIDGLFRFTSGIFTENYQTINGCDSVIDIDLTVVPRTVTLDTAFICIGDSMMIAGQLRTQEGLYSDTLQYVAGCDSVIRNTQLLFFQQPMLSLTQVGDICETDAAVTLTAMPAGGTFSGAGVTGNSFDPTATSVGIHPITYTYTDGNSCTYSTSEDAIVRANPVVNIGEFNNPLCLELQLVACPNATPAGGTYFGAGVEGVIFNMTTVGVGTFPVGYTYTNQFGCTSSDSTTIEIEKCFDDATGITQAFSNANESMVFPNPNNGQFTIQHNYLEEITAIIIDQNGRLIHQIINLPIVQQLDLSGLPAGLYHVQLIGKHTNKGHRIIIQ